MSEGIICTKPNVDAGTATNPNDMIFHSSYNAFKIVQSGTFGLGLVNGTTTYGTVTHNMNTINGFYAFVYLPSADITFGLNMNRVASLGTDISGAITSETSWQMGAANTATKLIVNMSSSSTETAKISWYIFDIHA